MNLKDRATLLRNSILLNVLFQKITNRIGYNPGMPNTISIEDICALFKEQNRTNNLNNYCLLGLIENSLNQSDKLPYSMTSLEERKVLSYLAEKYYHGQGEIIDLGSGVGGTVYPLAFGLHNNKSVSYKHHRIHAYDIFTSLGKGIKARGAELYFSQKSFKNKVKFSFENDSYLDIFVDNCQNYFDYIKINDGDVTLFSWDKKPVEIIHIDIAKTIHIWKHLVGEFFNSLIPGKSIIIHQDFTRVRLPWLIYSMGFILPYVKLIDPLINGTLYCRLIKPLPQKLIDRLKLDNFSIEQKIQSIIDMITTMKEMKFYGSINYELMQNLKDLAIAYVYFYAGEQKKAILQLEKQKSNKYLVWRFPEFFQEIEKVSS